METFLRVLAVIRMTAGVVGAIVLAALFSDASDRLAQIDSIRSLSAVQIIQFWTEEFIAPALLVIGLMIAVYIATRLEGFR